MDCGPAVLKCLLEGFGVNVSFGRLREACQTDVDGTSLDAVEQVGRDLGLDAEQMMLPVDHLLEPDTGSLPAIVVTRQPTGLTHFVVLWGHYRGLVQVMDPAAGRRWMGRAAFLRDVYRHAMPLPAADWREWAASEEFTGALAARLDRVGVRAADAVAGAVADPGWRPLAALDAAARLTIQLCRAGALARGRQARAVFERLLERDGAAIPDAYWSAVAGPDAPDGTPRLIVRGAVLVRVHGARGGPPEPERLSPDLRAALAEPPARPGRELLRLLRADGLLRPAAVVFSLALAAVGTAVEALLFRRLLDLGQILGPLRQRLGLAAVVTVLLLALLALRWPILTAVVGMGRRLETRLRVAFLTKIPRLGDRYLASRPSSDMAERSHALHALRALPEIGQAAVYAAMELVVTTAGLVWLAPRAAWVAVAAGVIEVLVPLLLQKPLGERDLRVRVHAGALARFYLDAMRGLFAVRSHGAERALRREHEGLLSDWVRSSRAFVATAVTVEAGQALVGVGLAAWLLVSYLEREAADGAALLLVHWALNLPVLGHELALAARQYPSLRNLTLRLLEPLGAREDGESPAVPAPADQATASGGGALDGASTPGVALALRGVSVVTAGHTVLRDVDLELPAGAHVAVVGASGAGKSTLVGLFLGWHRPQEGTLTVDGAPLDGARLARLRRETAWIDPAVQLWNRPLIDNLRYGAGPGEEAPGALAAALDAADLRGVLQLLPAGFQTPLGEGGGLMSGGEGQRVRLGRAVLRQGARLVILDEAFRGLDRAARRALLARARALWPGATLICITHDVTETLDFPRVLVIDGGRLVEDGDPGVLRERPSQYRTMLEAEARLQRELWQAGQFRTIEVADGLVRERGGPG
jgi:ATP-binding cassette subfamily B protein